MRYLLDTHILIWWIQENPRLTVEQKAAIDGARKGQPLFVSNITLWEISTLVSLHRLKIGMPLRDWLQAATAAPLVERCPSTPTIAAKLAEIPDSFHRDPADRILVATAQVMKATLLTADKKIIASQLVDTL